MILFSLLFQSFENPVVPSAKDRRSLKNSGLATRSNNPLFPRILAKLPTAAPCVTSASSYDVDGSKARGKMTSVLEANNLDDFIAAAMMSERAFESHRESTVVVGPDGVEMSLDDNGDVNEGGPAKDVDDVFDFEHMNVPRRPRWKVGMTADELDLKERTTFLEWRRGIAK